MLSSYPIRCTHKGCDRPAAYKIAARWSDGVTEELKTYALACEECLPEAFRESCRKNRACRRAKGETLELPGVYPLAHGRRDRQLERRPDLEASLLDQAEPGREP
jgi:hypothetical protein